MLSPNIAHQVTTRVLVNSLQHYCLSGEIHYPVKLFNLHLVKMIKPLHGELSVQNYMSLLQASIPFV